MSESVISVISEIGSGSVVPATVWAFSRMGPVIDSWRMYLKDRHERAVEERKMAADQRSISPTQNQNKTGLDSVALEPPKVPFPKWWFAIVVLSACLGLVDNFISREPPTRNTVAACALYVASLVACMIFGLLILLMNLSLHMFKELLASNLDTLRIISRPAEPTADEAHAPK